MSIRSFLLDDLAPFWRKHGVVIFVIIIASLGLLFWAKHTNTSSVPLEEQQKEMDKEMSK